MNQLTRESANSEAFRRKPPEPAMTVGLWLDPGGRSASTGVVLLVARDVALVS